MGKEQTTENKTENESTGINKWNKLQGKTMTNKIN